MPNGVAKPGTSGGAIARIGGPGRGRAVCWVGVDFRLTQEFDGSILVDSICWLIGSCADAYLHTITPLRWEVLQPLEYQGGGEGQLVSQAVSKSFVTFKL